MSPIASGSARTREAPRINRLDAPRCCPHCGNTTKHEVLYECSAPQTCYDSDGQLEKSLEGDVQLAYALLRCTTCRDVTLLSQLDFADWENPWLEYPSDYNLDPCVPAIVASNYREAKRVQTMSPNAFAVLVRRALEALCDDQGVSNGTLAARLKELADKGAIPGNLAEISSVLRELGNAGAHHTSQRVTVPLTWTMDQFFRVLIEYVYVAPHKLNSFQEELRNYEKGKQGAPPSDALPADQTPQRLREHCAPPPDTDNR
jgi:hypothetical protein